MSAISESPAQKRHQKAETELLRVFFLRWCEMHRRATDPACSREECQQAAQDLIDQSRKIRAFYE